MNIVRIIARLNVGGPARHVVWLTAGLQNDEFRSTLVTGVVPPGEDDMSYFAEAAGLSPTVIAEMSREISLRDAVTTWKCFRLFLRERPDLVHTHTAKAGTVGRLAGLMYRWLTPAILVGRPRRCKFVHTFHGHVFHSYYGNLKTRAFVLIERLLARLVTDRIVVLSEQQRQEINERFGVGRREQFRIVPLGLDLSTFKDWRSRRHILREELGADDDEILVGIVGRLTEVKNHAMFIDAAALFKQAYAPSSPHRVRFVIVGDGSIRAALERQSRQLGLDDDVIFSGTREDPENFYPALDIVALTSLNEGTPLTLIEAMTNERPVIATGVGGVVDLLGSVVSREDNGAASYAPCERGIRVESRDTDGFAAGLARLVGDAKLRNDLGSCGHAFIEKNFSKDRLMVDIIALYRELADQNVLARVATHAEPGVSSEQRI